MRNKIDYEELIEEFENSLEVEPKHGAKIAYEYVKKGSTYPILKEGVDWLLMKVRGRPVYVPRWVFE